MIRDLELMKKKAWLRLPQGVSRDEVHDALRHDYRDRPKRKIPKWTMAASMALLTGRRRGEIARLRWEDVSWRHGIISWHILKKGHVARLHLPMGNELRRILRRRHIAMGRPTRGYVIPHGSKSHEETEKELAHKAEAWSQGFHRWAKRHGWDLRFHDLRHLFALRLIAMGTPLNLVRIALAHSSLVTTSLYLEARPEDLAPYLP